MTQRLAGLGRLDRVHRRQLAAAVVARRPLLPASATSAIRPAVRFISRTTFRAMPSDHVRNWLSPRNPASCLQEPQGGLLRRVPRLVGVAEQAQAHAVPRVLQLAQKDRAGVAVSGSSGSQLRGVQKTCLSLEGECGDAPRRFRRPPFKIGSRPAIIVAPQAQPFQHALCWHAPENLPISGPAAMRHIRANFRSRPSLYNNRQGSILPRLPTSPLAACPLSRLHIDRGATTQPPPAGDEAVSHAWAQEKRQISGCLTGRRPRTATLAIELR